MLVLICVQRDASARTDRETMNIIYLLRVRATATAGYRR